jgi:hypothetical protein
MLTASVSIQLPISLQKRSQLRPFVFKPMSSVIHFIAVEIYSILPFNLIQQSIDPLAHLPPLPGLMYAL